jgi:hypothetical protein
LESSAGPNTFGADEKSGGDSETVGKMFRWRRKNSPKTPSPAPHIAEDAAIDEPLLFFFLRELIWYYGDIVS